MQCPCQPVEKVFRERRDVSALCACCLCFPFGVLLLHVHSEAEHIITSECFVSFVSFVVFVFSFWIPSPRSFVSCRDAAHRARRTRMPSCWSSVASRLFVDSCRQVGSLKWRLFVFDPLQKRKESSTVPPLGQHYIVPCICLMKSCFWFLVFSTKVLIHSCMNPSGRLSQAKSLPETFVPRLNTGDVALRSDS